MKVIIDDREPIELPETFTYKQLRLFKRASGGLRPTEIGDAVATLDPDAALGFAAVALMVVGEPIDIEALLEKDAGSIVLDFSKDEPDAAKEEDTDVPPADAGADQPRRRSAASTPKK